MKQISILIYVVLLFEKSVIANQNDKIELNFQEVVKENSKYPPMVDKCPLRIVGGQKANINEVPYQIVIQAYVLPSDYWKLVGGGAIVTQQHVVSAAHCFPKSSWNKETYRILAGTGKMGKMLNEQKFSTIGRRILYCFRHKYYDSEELTHDFAVLMVICDILFYFKLDYPLIFSENIQPIPMIRPGHGIQLQVDGLCLVSGFGAVTTYKLSADLRIVCVPIVSTMDCKRYFGNHIQSHHLCAGKDGKDSCWRIFETATYYLEIQCMGGVCSTTCCDLQLNESH
ncbi:trypsin-like isoform X2 [Spodoptera litura]|uniref:Trypsin-like isoform X2 n=1 Tax=Spodoptera litura TaxID=69820 RepID=A0A9J7DR35_SPOLT|nr:trypsin-like isoform X2 [Spodoptera litura]